LQESFHTTIFELKNVTVSYGIKHTNIAIGQSHPTIKQQGTYMWVKFKICLDVQSVGNQTAWFSEYVMEAQL